MKINNETVGISAEVAIAHACGVKVSEKYRNRADSDTVKKIKGYVTDVFNDLGIPKPVKHCAEKQNPVDSILKTGKTLSVKTNKTKLGKVAPQEIGQPTSKTYFKKVGKNWNLIPQKYLMILRAAQSFSRNSPWKTLMRFWISTGNTCFRAIIWFICTISLEKRMNRNLYCLRKLKNRPNGKKVKSHLPRVAANGTKATL